MPLSKDEIAEIATVTVAILQAQTPQLMEKTETVTFFPGTKPTELDKNTFCRDCLRGQPDYFVSQEELDAWEAGMPLSRHERSGIAKVIHYDAIKARERVKDKTNTTCVHCGKPRN